MTTLAFFLLLVTFWENPFARYWQVSPGDIQPAMGFHPFPFGLEHLLDKFCILLIGTHCSPRIL